MNSPELLSSLEDVLSEDSFTTYLHPRRPLYQATRNQIGILFVHLFAFAQNISRDVWPGVPLKSAASSRVCVFMQGSFGGLVLAPAYFFASRILSIVVRWCWGFQKYALNPFGFNWTSSPDWLLVRSHKIVGCTGPVKPDWRHFRMGAFSHYNLVQLSVILSSRHLQNMP